ncbi:MAG: Ribosomal RNA small subunit methyltransferase I [Chlamydiae bacterium]|nr:Ribosomal RNA small subunit methyltransferase I [Chlamydiota bacterium]
MLYLIATPIGNLADITVRGLKTIEECDYLLCEDTRHSRRLLSHYDLRKPLKSYHKFNEAKREEEIIKDLKSGITIGLLSDAGTPGISDPGGRLVKKCRELALEVCAIPGPCSPIVALVASGLDTTRFQFVGFLPRKKGKLTKILEESLAYPGTTICFESPHRILKSLKVLGDLAPDRKVVVARELTKKFEEYAQGTATELLEKWKTSPPKGEIILMI